MPSWRVGAEAVVFGAMFAESGSGTRQTVILFAASCVYVGEQASSQQSLLLHGQGILVDVCW
jgi:hypothetical protein